MTLCHWVSTQYVIDTEDEGTMILQKVRNYSSSQHCHHITRDLSLTKKGPVGAVSVGLSVNLKWIFKKEVCEDVNWIEVPEDTGSASWLVILESCGNVGSV